MDAVPLYFSLIIRQKKKLYRYKISATHNRYMNEEIRENLCGFYWFDIDTFVAVYCSNMLLFTNRKSNHIITYVDSMKTTFAQCNIMFSFIYTQLGFFFNSPFFTFKYKICLFYFHLSSLCAKLSLLSIYVY